MYCTVSFTPEDSLHFVLRITIKRILLMQLKYKYKSIQSHFCCIFSIKKQFENLLSDIIDSILGL